MLASNNAQDDVLAKEAAKIAYKRQQNEQRRLRIHNAKQRTIGLDIAALDAQVEEKKRRQAHNNDILNFERAQALEIERILAASMEEERRMKEFQMRQMKESWADNAARKEMEKKQSPSADFDLERSGPASLQKMDGEDVNRVERIQKQRQQMKDWIQDQIAQKQYVKQVEMEEELNYGEMIKAIDEIREATEKEEKEMRKYIIDTVKADNLELAMGQKQRRAVQNSINGANNEALPTSLNCFDESRASAIGPDGKVKRIDMFRGFTEEQRRTIFQQNQDIIRHNAMSKANGQRMDDEWVMQQAMAMRAMEQAAYEEQCMRDAMKSDQLAFLQQQAEEQRRRKQEWDATKNGTIEEGFFENFGKDCR